MTPTFSVVVPAFNAAATVAATIRSIQSQTREDLEVVVVDDGSIDETADVVMSVGDERLRIVRQPNAGLAAARNRGLRECNGRYVALLDADDLWLPEFLSETAVLLDGRQGVGAVYADAWVLDHESGRIRRTTAMAYQDPPPPTLTDPTSLFRRLLRGNFIISSSVVRREAFDRVGPYREDLRRSEDYELWLRLTAAGYSLRRAPGVLWVHREIGGSLSADIPAMIDAGRRVYDIVATTYPVAPDLLRLAEVRRDEYARVYDVLTGVSPPTARERLFTTGRALKRRLHERRLWLAEPPLEVAELLVSVGDSSRVS